MGKRLFEISVAINQSAIMVFGMNSPFTKHSYKNIRTIAQSDGRLHALKFIRLFHVGNYEQAKTCLSDILNNEAWTMPQIQADINGMRERVRLNRL
jgi:hypothetical protein